MFPMYLCLMLRVLCIICSTLFVSETSSERPLGLVDVESARELLLHE